MPVRGRARMLCAMSSRHAGIYVEILIRAPMDALWEHTQEPALHERWDLRFTTIDYLPKSSEDAPQRFLYATRIGLGLAVAGEGETRGQRDLPGGGRMSALKFSSSDRLSLIREGSGYWKYVPTDEGVRFLTWYDYRTRFGAAGMWFDRLAFRPLMGWATAWSFDRLRLWLEHGIAPDLALRHFLTRGLARGALASVFLYHGIVPKLLFHHADEAAMLRDGGVPAGAVPAATMAFGVLEILFAVVLLAAWTRRWPAVVSVGLMLAATAGVAWSWGRGAGRRVGGGPRRAR